MDPDRIEQLREPSVFPERDSSVELIQTHLSVVCLSGDSAYKFKKAIQLPFADFSTLEARRRFCAEELRLNRRLCEGIYQEVAKLAREEDGTLRVGGHGEIVDYAVKMRRLPAERMMDVMLEANEVTRPHIEEIAKVMTEFHRGADRGDEVDEHGSPDRLQVFARANFEETVKQRRTIFPDMLHRVMQVRTDLDFARNLPVMRRRLEEGMVVDGHGDLHARNICLTEPVAIYDCIEFEPAFRCADVATEHAFLLMDLRFRGHPEWARAYLEEVKRRTGDADFERLVPMLMQYRAMVRAKVAAITAEEAEVSKETRSASMRTAKDYLRFAASVAIEDSGPWWINLCGLPGSGKTTTAGELARIPKWPVFSSDRVRKELAGVAPEESLPASCYTKEFSREVYGELLNRAAEASRRGEQVVLLDANFRSADQRNEAAEAAQAAGSKPVVVFLDTGPEIAESRILEREKEGTSESDADVAIYRRLAEEFESPSAEDIARTVAIVAGESPARELADEILSILVG